MNKLFLFCLPLLSCGQIAMGLPPASPITFAEQPFPDVPPSMISLDGNGFVSWECEQEDYNQNTIQIRCGFTNISQNLQAQCLNISIEDKNHIELGRTHIYSGLLLPKETKEELAFFTKKRRQEIMDQCNKDTSACQLITTDCTTDLTISP